MKPNTLSEKKTDQNWYSPDSVSLEDLKILTGQKVTLRDYPLASDIGGGQVPLYDCAALRRLLAQPEGRCRIMAEWVSALKDGPGIIVLKQAFDDVEALDHVTVQFEKLIANERRNGMETGDHFAKKGANDRVWNALEKLCLLDPEGFVRYYANDMIALVSEAWLGPAYQITSQVNVVNPGGEAQSVHRDYHLGFQSPQQVSQYPAHVHALSPFLTLQGAVAHCDMPLESGPTLYMPFTQKYGPGYLATQTPEVREWFNENYLQLPLHKGDAVFSARHCFTLRGVTVPEAQGGWPISFRCRPHSDGRWRVWIGPVWPVLCIRCCRNTTGTKALHRRQLAGSLPQVRKAMPFRPISIATHRLVGWHRKVNRPCSVRRWRKTGQRRVSSKRLQNGSEAH